LQYAFKFDAGLAAGNPHVMCNDLDSHLLFLHSSTSLSILFRIAVSFKFKFSNFVIEFLVGFEIMFVSLINKIIYI